MIKKLKKLFSREEVVDNTTPIFEDLGFYLKDKDGSVHYVSVDILRAEDGLLEIQYASSSDLEARGLEPYLEEAVMKMMEGVDVE